MKNKFFNILYLKPILFILCLRIISQIAQDVLRKSERHPSHTSWISWGHPKFIPGPPQDILRKSKRAALFNPQDILKTFRRFILGSSQDIRVSYGLPMDVSWRSMLSSYILKGSQNIPGYIQDNPENVLCYLDWKKNLVYLSNI